MAKKPQAPRADALAFVVVKDCKRYLVIDCDEMKLEIEDTEPKRQRSALELLEAYNSLYQAAVMPYLTKMTKMRRLALSIRRLVAGQPLPLV